MKQYNNCLLIGKFMPPHKGHEYMIRFAMEQARNVHVVVDCLVNQTTSPLIRAQWLKEQIPSANVYALQNFMPQEPSETPEFWNIWRTSLFEAIDPIKPDLVIASMDYGWELAKQMNADFIPADINRETFPISATMLRENVYKHWDFLMDSAKPHFVKKVCILGPESTGKSTIGKKLANTLNTIYIPEYAKMVLEKQCGIFYYNNIMQFVQAQIASENAASKFANKVMICDSSAITTKIFSQLVFNHYPSEIDQIITQQNYDHYLLYYPDIPFTNATHRKVISSSDDTRFSMFEQFKSILINLKLPFTIIYGNYEEKEKESLKIIKQIIDI